MVQSMIATTIKRSPIYGKLILQRLNSHGDRLHISNAPGRF